MALFAEGTLNAHKPWGDAQGVKGGESFEAVGEVDEMLAGGEWWQ